MIRAGALRHVLQLYRINRDARNEFGELATEYELIKPFRAEILSAKQAVQRLANGAILPVNMVFHCRFMPGVDVNTDMAVLYSGKYYEITSVENPGGRNIELYLVTEHKI